MSAVARFSDPLRRLTLTHLTADLCVMSRMIRLETNSQIVLGHMTHLFPQAAPSSLSVPDFVWRFVAEKDSGARPHWPELKAFSGDGLRYVNIGQRNFLAIDLEAREAIGFLSEDLANDAIGFSSVFAATLFDLTAAALGLVQIGAACVALHGKALLIFGPSHSGKTTSTYLAGKLGLEFHADEACFLDLKSGGLRAWGQFWPAAFREDTVQFLPELASSTRRFHYADLTFLSFEHHPFRGPSDQSVTPVGCVLLERQVGNFPQLIPLLPGERQGRLTDGLAFKDEERFAAQTGNALRELAKLPAYRLPYGKDPAVAATFFRSILMVHHSLEASQ